MQWGNESPVCLKGVCLHAGLRYSTHPVIVILRVNHDWFGRWEMESSAEGNEPEKWNEQERQQNVIINWSGDCSEDVVTTFLEKEKKGGGSIILAPFQRSTGGMSGVHIQKVHRNQVHFVFKNRNPPSINQDNHFPPIQA